MPLLLLVFTRSSDPELWDHEKVEEINQKDAERRSEGSFEEVPRRHSLQEQERLQARFGAGAQRLC